MAIRYDSLGPTDAPALCFASSVGMPTDMNEAPDAANTNTVIPLRLKSYTPPSVKMAVDTYGSVPEAQLPNKAAYEGIVELPKATMEGEIETPCVALGQNFVPDVIVDDIRYTWGGLIALLFEQEKLDGSGFYTDRVDPLWFRDPFGRIYTNPQIIAFEAAFVEQVPGRNTFSMTLKV